MRSFAVLLAAAVPAAAQVAGQDGRESSFTHVMGQAVVVGTRTDPIPDGGRESRVSLSQPVVMLQAGRGALRLTTSVNLEGLTMPEGEPTIGAYGEGFIDRRHPHTYLHEFMVGAVRPLGRGAVSLMAGKGFVPFGTDDPMVRPFQRYPVNHHLAQVLERWTAIAAVRSGPVALEAALFNGDEPESPGQWPRLARFGDSWALRATAAPARGLEVQGSHARVHSPEHRPGEGVDQTKWSVAARGERTVGRTDLYALAEWARTDEAGGFFRFTSWLGEASAQQGPVRLSYRIERTVRPEEEREPFSPFRSARPHLENAILGATRFTLHTVQLERRFALRGGAGLAPFAELTLGGMQATVAGAVLDPQVFYRGTRIRTLAVGLRADIGGRMRRMGRYGVVAPSPHPPAAHGAGGHP